jgi:simple sugar transport system ATP-binding protein
MSDLIELDAISKRFGDVCANDVVSLSLRAGEVLALLGENGAGKSTLMKILYGFYPADTGTIRLDDKPVHIRSPRDAMALGIGMVFQQFNLIPALSIEENLMLAWPHAPWWQARHRPAFRQLTATYLRLLGDDQADTKKAVAELAVGEKQLLEIAKVLNLDARVVILDEPTSVLTPLEAERLWKLVRTMALEGRAVVMITHKMEDVMACADRVAVMRRGRLVGEFATHEKTTDEIITLVMGEAPLPPTRARVLDAAPPRLLVKDLYAEDGLARLSGIDFCAHAGEVLGIAGVSGSGQKLLADAVAGIAAINTGEVLLDGERTSRSAHEMPPALTRIGYIPEAPLANAVAADLDLAFNLDLKTILNWRFFPRRAEHVEHARELIAAYDVRPPEPDKRAGDLSGGNLQKLVSARELSGTPDLVVACYPTMGLDVQASAAIYRELFRHAERGAVVLWISEDLDDLLAYAHRIAVLFQGRLVASLTPGDTDRNTLGRLMTGEGQRSPSSAGVIHANVST